MKNRIIQMLDMQDKMNAKVHPEWKTQGFAWHRAIFVECAEMMDHYGWKWWKRQDPDVEQVKLELVDIFHFGLSLDHLTGASYEVLAEQIASNMTVEKSGDFLGALEKFAVATLGGKCFHSRLFAQLMVDVDMTFDDLYVGYIGKNVLNFFRQDNGYKDGSYRKHWHDGREDNEHLVEIIASLDASSESFADDLQKALAVRYAQ